MFKKVVVGISGGVDSAVAALLLKNKGFSVTAMFMKNWDIVDETGVCTTEKEYEYAQWVCNKLNIPIVQVNFVKEYWNAIFSDLVEKYESGFTPNPDILCNKNIKFDKFFHFARSEFKADAIATGHYVRTSFGPYLERFKPGIDVKLLTAIDHNKDQTFFLCQVQQEALRYYMFPLGSLLKPDVKKIALEAGLDLVARKKESMGICFVGKRNFRDFISEYIDDKPGHFIDLDTGAVVGEHRGIHHWTVGQRCKIPGHDRPYHIFGKDIETRNIIIVKGTNHSALYSDFVTTETPHWISQEPNELQNNNAILRCDFRFQHRNPLVPCNVYKTPGDRLAIRLSQPLRAITRGQYAVLYREEECLGSAQIVEVGPSYYMLNRDVNF